jgi:phosphoglycerol transferase MdoB-like AlkP superfamily enzyme
MRTAQRLFSVLRARQSAELENRTQRTLYYVWNGAALLLSSLGTTVLSLALAIGGYDIEEFYGYFSHPLILLLNWLPILLLQILLFCACGRQWLAFLLTALPILLASTGNYYKILFRYDPFTFQDLDSIKAGLGVAEDYPLRLNVRIVAAGLWILLGTPALAWLARGRAAARTRLAGAALCLAAAVGLWFGAYRRDGLYLHTALDNNYIGDLTEQQHFIANGFVYPFLHSITQSPELPPEGYDPERAAAVLAAYSDEAIPPERAVNVLVLQLESFTDLEAIGVTGLDESAYAVLRRLQAESVSGIMVANVIGGGTIRTERCVLTGCSEMPAVTEDCASYVRWLNSQGYFTTGSHPNRPDFYNRINVAEYLGFQEYLFSHNHYEALTGGQWNCDAVFLPEIFRLFRERAAAGDRVFSFNVSLQAHSPYDPETVNRPGVYWRSDTASRDFCETVNAYLSLIVETQELLWEQLEALRTDPAPAVVLIYGDHNPAFSFPASYEPFGLRFEPGSEEELLSRYGTPYLIWANDAAKALLDDDFRGEGPVLSPGFLLNYLFRRLGWTGDAYIQYVSAVMDELPLISSSGCYLEDGQFTHRLSPEGEALLLEYRQIQYYALHRPVEDP